MKEAEGEYSRQRLRSLADEWIADFPEFLTFVDVLKKQPSRLLVQEISEDRCLEVAIRMIEERKNDTREPADLLRAIENDPTRTMAFRNWLVAAFYRVGIVGLKLEAFETVVWSTTGCRSISVAEITPTTRVVIHPCFWRSLGVNPASCA